MNIVIRSPNWIGDCVMALPAIRTLKKYVPKLRIFIAARPHLLGVYKNIPEISGVISISGNRDSLFRTAAEIRSHQFEWGLLFTNSFHSALLFKLARIPHLLGYKKDLRGFMLTRKLCFPKNDRHHIYFYLDLAAAFIKELTGSEPDEQGKPNHLAINADEHKEITAILEEQGIDSPGTWIGISPSAAYGTAKQWLPERFRELIGRLIDESTQQGKDRRILLFGSADEREKIADIIGPLDIQVRGKVFNLAGKLSLRKSISAISLCSAFVSNDSGLMHVASALQIPLAALFGPTEPHKTGPLSTEAQVFYYPQVCAPCRHRVCPLEPPHHHRCMKAVTVAEVYEKVMALMQKREASGE